jgi:hypothetical protein
MSVLDRLTDDDLKTLVGLRDSQIQELMRRVKFLEDERERLERFSAAKTRRIIVLSEDIAELKKGVMNG